VGTNIGSISLPVAKAGHSVISFEMMRDNALKCAKVSQLTMSAVICSCLMSV